MKVLLTPHDIAGQMGILARSLRSAGTDAWSVNFGTRSGYLNFEVDETVQFLPDTPRSLRLVRSTYRTQQLLRQYSVVHYFFGRSMLPKLLDVRAARAAGKAVVVHFRGRDITTNNQSISGSAALVPPGVDLPLRGNERQRELVRSWKRLADIQLISTPDLWREIPDATLIPQAIELEHWPRCPARRKNRGPVRVGHAPTNQGLKGTSFVVDAVSSLRDRGVNIELDLIEGVPPRDVRARMERCDVAIDQVVQGAYGNVTIQFMALGRPTMNFLDPMYQQRGLDVPTVQTTPQTLANDLLDLISSPQSELENLTDRARDYVEKTHSGPVIAARLQRLYASIATGDRK